MLVLRKNKRKIFAAAAAALIVILSIVPAFAAQPVTPDMVRENGVTIQAPVYIDTFGYVTKWNGETYNNGINYCFGNVRAGDMFTVPYIDVTVPSGKRLSGWRVGITIAPVQSAVGTPVLLYQEGSSFMITESMLTFLDDAYNSFGQSNYEIRIIVRPYVIDAAEEDDEYHTNAFIRVINALWQNFYTSFVELTSSMSFFGISILSVIGILVAVLVVFYIIKTVRH